MLNHLHSLVLPCASAGQCQIRLGSVSNWSPFVCASAHLPFSLLVRLQLFCVPVVFVAACLSTIVLWCRFLIVSSLKTIKQNFANWAKQLWVLAACSAAIDAKWSPTEEPGVAVPIYMLSRVEPCLFRLFVCYLQMACLSSLQRHGHYTAQVSQSQLGLHTSQWQIPCGSIDGTCQCHTDSSPTPSGLCLW